MLKMELPQSLNLYITFIEKEGPFLKVWGQAEKNNVIYVDQFLSGISLQFNAGLSKVSPENLQCGTLVCAKYEDNKYYRARITNIFIRESVVEVTFIDFGNRHIISCENIRSLQECPSSFISIPPLAIGFIFAEAHCVGGGEWNDSIFESIAKEFRFREVQCHLLSQATQYYLVKLYVDATDICSLLIQRGLMQAISLQAQQAVLLSMSIQRQTAPAPPSTQTAAAINTYKAVTLEPGCLYPVYVSYVNDGPCHFSVQLKQSEEILAKLMKDINGVILKLLEDVPIPGTLCLARCQEDGNVCRAVVTNEVDNQFKVYYVDFGNYETVSLDCLFQIPFKYVIPKVMAIRYSLAGVEKSTVTIEMQVAFKKFVDNRMLHMKVLPTPTRVAVPKCELWDPENKTSALEVVNRAAQHSYPEPIPLNRGFSQPVKVSFVYSCNRLYVQLVSKETELSNLMSDLQEICLTSSPIEASDIKRGLPCCALFLADSLWYRSQIVEVLGETVKVRYIDYGNEEEVDINLLKTIDGEQLTVLRPQAIECCLNGYQNMGDDPERDGFLEEIILENTFTMKVVEMFGKKVLIELFDLSNYNVASLLLDKIAAATSQVSPMLVQAGNKIEHRKSLSQHREGQAPHKEGYSQHRDGQRDDHRGDRDFKTGRDDSNWNSKSNDRSEKPWRNDNRENRSFDKNDNDGRSSWRENNKGFSPNNQRQNRQRSNESDSWSTINNDSNGNSGLNTSENAANSNTDTMKDDEWNSPSNDDGVRQNRRHDDHGKNRRGFDNDRGSKFDNDRGSKFDNDRGSKFDNDRGSKFDNDRGSKFDNDRGDRYAGKKWDGGYGKKPDFRKDENQLSPNDSEQSYHKGPRSSSRIERGGRGGKFERNYDKPRDASFTSNSIGEDSWNVSAVVPSIDAAPVSASFTTLEVIGTETKVKISWFHHPCHFFCQIADSQDQFNTMMEEIQEFYKNQKPERSSVGAPVIGLFPEDDVLYRAQVLEIIGSSYKVYYVDFGNVSTIQKIWPIDKKFMNLPAQAIVCSLNGIAPIGDTWSSNPDSFSKYFEKDNFTCSFINKDEEKTYVNILYESEDIAQLLIQDGLAVSTLSIIPEIEIPLLLNQQFRAVLISVNNLSDIIIALECGLAVSCTMHNLETATETFEDELRGLLEQTVIVYVDNVIDNRLVITLYDTEGYKIVVLNPDDGALESVELPCPMLVLHSTIAGYVCHADQNRIFIQPLEYSEVIEYLLNELFATYNDQPQECPICPEEGLLYVVHSNDGNWYRGRVLSCDDEKATVCYVDYGNSEEVALSELRELANTFLEIPFLCLEVIVSSDATAFMYKEVAGNIIFGEEGWEGTVNIIESSSTESAGIEDSCDTGYISSSLEKPGDVPVENESSNYSTEGVMVEVAHNLGIQDETIIPNIDDKSEFENVPTIEDGEMQQHLDKEAEVEKVVDTFEEREMQHHSYEEPEVLEDGEMQQHSYEEVSYEVHEVVEDGEMQQHLDEDAEIKNVVPTIEDEEMQQHLDEEAEVENAVQSIEDGEMQQHFDESVAIGTSVYTSHVDSPNQFYLQFHDALSEIDDLQNGIQTGAPEWSVIENPAAGIICAAPYSGNQMWYRAVILDADEDITTVRFIDFGNTDVIDNKTTQIKMLPPNLLSLAVYATRCSLKLEPLDEEWSTNATTIFEELAMNGIVTAEFLDQDEKTNYVELYSDGVNIREELIQRKLAMTSTQTEETKSTGFVSHLNSPSEFWIQLENCVDELEWIAEQLSFAESFEELEDLAPGTLCAALFPDDTMWYRARILSNTVAGIELLFIDYGNSCTSSSLRQLPEDLVVTAPLAQKCSLQKPEGIPTWSPEAAAKFREISAEGQTIFTVKKISTGETSIVQLFIDEEDVSTMLLPDTEEGYVKAVDSLERLQIEKGDGEPLEGSFQLEAMSGQELNEEAEQNFEQLNKQGSTLFQIEFINNNTVRLYLNGHDIRPQLGGIKNTSFDYSKIEEDLYSNEVVNISEEQTEIKSGLIQDNVDDLDKLDSRIQYSAEENIYELNDVDTLEIKNDSDENTFLEKPHSGSLLPGAAASSSELVDEPIIVDQIETPSVECHHLEDTIQLPLEIDAKPTDTRSAEETESNNSVQDNSQTLSISQCESPKSSNTQSNDRIERSTQTDEGEYETVKLSEIPEESEIVESLEECPPFTYSGKSPVANLNQEQQSNETLHDGSLTMNTGEYKPLTSTEGLDVNEYPKKSSSVDITISIVKSSSQLFENYDSVQDSFQTSNIIECEPQIITASTEESVLEESTKTSSPVEDPTNYSPVETSVESPNQERPNDETVQHRSQTRNTGEYNEPPVTSSNQECMNEDTRQDSFRTLNSIENEPRTSTASLEESVVEESPNIFSIENAIVPCPVESPVIKNDDTVQDSFQTSNNIECEPHIITASTEESVLEKSTKTSSPVEDPTNYSPVETSVESPNQERPNDETVQHRSQTKNTAEYNEPPVTSSNQEFMNEDTLQDSFRTLNNIENEPRTSAASLEESVVEESPNIFSVENAIVPCPVESPVIKNDDTVQDSFQTSNNIECEPQIITASTEESVLEESTKTSSPVEDPTNYSPVETSVASPNQERQNDETVQHRSQTKNTAEYNEPPVTSSNQEFMNEDTLQDSFQTLNNIENEPRTSTASLEESVVEESPNIFSVENAIVPCPVESPVIKNDDTVQDSFQTSNNIECEPQIITASTEESVLEESTKTSSPVEDPTNYSPVETSVASPNQERQNDETVQHISQTKNTAEYNEPPVTSSNQEFMNEDTLQDRFLTLNNIENEPRTSTASLEESVVEESPYIFSIQNAIVPCPVESPVIENDDTVQDSFKTLNSDDESGVKESQTESFLIEDTTLSSPVESPVASSCQNDDAEQGSFETLNIIEYEPHSSTAGPQEPVVKFFYCSQIRSSTVDVTTSAVELPIANSNYEIQNDNTVQHNSQAVSTGQYEPHTSSVSTEESVVEESPKNSSVDITASNVNSTVASSNQDLQIGNTVKDNLQILNTDKCDSPTSTVNPEKSDIQESPKISSSDTYVAIPIISPEVSSSSLEIPSCSKSLDSDKPSPENVLEETEVKVSGCVDHQQVNEGIADHIVLENDNAVPNNVPISSDSGNESCPTTPQKKMRVAATTNSPEETKNLPGRCLLDNIETGSSSQNIRNNVYLDGDIGGESVVSQEKSLEKGKVPNEIVKDIHTALEIEGSFEESTNNILSEIVEIDDSFIDLAKPPKSAESESTPISPENTPNSSTEMDITIPVNPTLSSSNQGNDTVQTVVDTHSDDYSESQELFAETKLSKLTMSEQISQEPSEGQLSKKNDDEEHIIITVPAGKCSIIKQSEIQTDEVAPTIESGESEISSSSEKVKKSFKPDVNVKDTKETSNKPSTEKVVKTSIRVSLSVAKVLASKKDEISSPATIPKKSKQAPSPKVTTVSKTVSKQSSVKVEAKSTQQKLPIKISTSEPLRSSTAKNDSSKSNAPGKATTLGSSKKNSSSNGAKGLGTSKKDIINKERDLNLAMLLRKTDKGISESTVNKGVEMSERDSKIEKGKFESKDSTELVHNTEENSSVTYVLESDQICQDEDHKTEESDVESSSLHSDLKEMKSVEDVEQEKKLDQ